MKITSFGVLVAAGLLAAPLHAAQETEFKDESGKIIFKYVIEVPSGVAPAATTDPAKQVGMVVCLQEHDNPTGNDIFPVRQWLIRQGILDNYILLAPETQAPRTNLEHYQAIEKLIAWAKKTYPINPRRVYMFGKGQGSKIAIEFTILHPDISTVGIGYSWGAWLMPSEVSESLDYVNSAPELYLTLGRRDLANHLTTVRDAYPRLKAKGYHLIYREFDELGDRTYHPPSNDDALGWATRMRNKNIAPSADELKLLKAFSGAPPAVVNGYYPTLALVGGAPAGAVLQKLFASKDVNVRLAAVETCRNGVFGDATTSALTKLVADPSANVRRAAIQALAMYANWRYDAAQKTLIQVATDKSANPLERLNATDAIGYAVRLQAPGYRQDPQMFQALISLLGQQEREDPVRTAARTTLAPISRRTPTGGWDKWLADITAQEMGSLKDYEICGLGKAATGTTYPGNRGSQEPVDLFCMGGSALMGYNLGTGQKGKVDVVSAFQNTLKAAERGYVPAQTAVGMMYAGGKGVQQSYPEAGKWWIKASESGDLIAARLTWNLYANGGGTPRDRDIANQWAKVIGEPIQAPRPAAPATPPAGSNP